MSSPRSARVRAPSLPSSSLRRRIPALAACALGAVVVSAPAEGAPRPGEATAVAVEPKGGAPVTLAEVASQVEPGATHLADLKDLLRREVEAELAAIDWSKESLRRRYKLSASLVRLETAQARGTLQVSCTVSAAVRDDRGVVLAVVEGRARAEGTSSGGAITEQGALSGAVRGAITAVPEALRRLK